MSINITARPSPIQEPVRCAVPSGKTISELFPDLSPQVQVEVNGKLLRKRDYDSYALREDDMVVASRFPAGDTDTNKNIARSALLIAVAVGSAAIGNYAGSAWGFSQLAAAGLTTAVNLAGNLAVNALIPLPQGPTNPETEPVAFNRMGALTGTRNRMSPYSVVPRVYGKHRLYPPLAARPYTEIFSNEQYLRCLFCAGYGPLKLSEPKIGDTVIGTFDASNNFTSNGNFEGIEIDVAEEPGNYTSSVSEEAVGVELADTGDSAIRTTDADIDEFSLEFLFPQGLFSVASNGATRSAEVEIKIEMRPTGATTWDPVSDGSFPLYVLGSRFSKFAHVLGGVWSAENSARETLRVGMSLEVDPGQYDIRVTRQTGTGDGGAEDTTAVIDGARWNVIRSIKDEHPTDLPGVVMIGMKVKATDQLSGILDNFSVVAESRLATYNGSSWDTPTFNASTGGGSGGALTSNPAWIFADILTGGANARGAAKSKLNAATLKAWADWCTTNGFEYNGVIDSKATVQQLARSVAAAGRASYGLQDGLHTVVRDLVGQTPVQMFTPRNSWGFSASKGFPELPHGLKIRFRNAASDWKTEENIVYADGYSEDGTGCQFDDGTGVCKKATKFETLELDGVTGWPQAWKMGRYRLAEAKLRPEVYTLNVDAEHLVCQRGDRVKVAHDVTLWGARWGRLLEVTRDGSGNVTQVRVDEPAEMQTGTSYQLRVRKADGTFAEIDVDTAAGQHQLLIVTTPDVYNIARGDLFAFGEQATETVDCKVIGIAPQPDLSARLTLVDAADAIHNADQGTVPPFDPQITDSVDLDRLPPPAPKITNIRSDGDTLYPDADSNPHLRIVVSFEVSGGNPSATVEGRFRRDGDTGAWTSFGSVEASVGSIALEGVVRGATYIVQIRSRIGERISEWVSSTPHSVGGGIVLPGDESKAIGYISADMDGTFTTVACVLQGQARQGIDYYIVNQLERTLYAITPTETKGPGSVSLGIEEQVIQAPEGSYIVMVPGQEEIEFDVLGDKLSELNNEVVPELETNLETLDGNLSDLEAILGNPPDNASFFASIVTHQAWINELVTSQGWFDKLVTNNLFADKVATNQAFTDSLVANDAFIDELFANNIEITGSFTNTTGDWVMGPDGIEFAIPDTWPWESTDLVWKASVSGEESRIGSESPNRPQINYQSFGHQFLVDINDPIFVLDKDGFGDKSAQFVGLDRLVFPSLSLPTSRASTESIYEVYLNFVSDSGGDYYELRIRANT